LYRATLVLLFRSEDNHLEVRLRVALELIINRRDYLNGDVIQAISDHRVDGVTESVVQRSVLYNDDTEARAAERRNIPHTE
jgi:hypothetical protein